MSVSQLSDLCDDVDEDVVGFLIDQYGISAETAAAIRRMIDSDGSRWSIAAVANGLLTPVQLKEALLWANRHRTEAPVESIVERALARPRSQLVPSTGFDVRPGPQVPFVHDPYSSRSEKIRTLRTELLLLNDSTTMLLAVVGSGPSEGRSALAAELAMSFGQLGRRTLLVDTDLRKPSQHRLFQTNNNLGLAESIEGGSSCVMHRVHGPSAMSLLTAGNASSNPLELLSDRRFDRLTNEWRRQFEFVILDTPPVSQYSDGLAVATLAGNVLIVSRSVATSFNEMKEMLRRLASTRSRILGAVINHF